MKTIGLVGGIASGKSLVGKMLVELGAGLLDGDRTGHAVLAEDAEVHRAIRERWGDAVFAADGSVDRAAIAARVFGDTDAAKSELRFLENLLHPRIRKRFLQQRDQYSADGKPAVILDAPILLEAGWGAVCDVVLFVDTPRELRLVRARGRGWTDAQFTRREQAQLPVDEKRRGAHAVISNTGSVDDLRRAVHDFWRNHVVDSRLSGAGRVP